MRKDVIGLGPTLLIAVLSLGCSSGGSGGSTGTSSAVAGTNGASSSAAASSGTSAGGSSTSGGSTATATTGGATSAGSTGGTSSSSGTTGSGCNPNNDCNDLSNTAPVVEEEQQPTDPPQPDGGTLVDGTYFLTAVTVYTGDGGASGPDGRMTQQTSTSASGTGQSVTTEGGCTSHSSSALTFDGNMIALTGTCPACTPPPCGSVALGYTATPSTFILFAGSPPRVTVQTYTLQQ